jgi:hypothetical protein
LATLGVAFLIQRWRRPLSASVSGAASAAVHPSSVLDRIRKETDV